MEYHKLLDEYEKWQNGGCNRRLQEVKEKQTRRAIKSVTRYYMETSLSAQEAEEAWERVLADDKPSNELRVSKEEGKWEKRVLRDDFPIFDYYNLINPLEFMINMVDPHGTNIKRLRNSFPILSASEQMDYLRARYDEGMKKIGRNRGRVASDLRALRSQMKLRELFNIDSAFMNMELRKFLNINDNGEDIYAWQEVTASGSGWKEQPSIGSQYHQSKAPDTQVSIIIGYYQNDLGNKNYNAPIYKSVYNRLNAKFCHEDGREAVFAYPGDGKHINRDPDRGTFNYIDAISNLIGHGIYDVQPFKNNLPDGFTEDSLKLHNGHGHINSYYWKY
jgi:hypothetical protein